MHSVSIIGAGNIGSRHLQALAQSKLPLNICVVDPDKAALDLSLTRWESVEKKSDFKISFLSKVSDLPRNIDISILATNSDVRFDIIAQLFECSKVNYLVLEKFLFTNPVQYDLTEELLYKHRVNAFVNCPMRSYPHYQQIAQQLQSDAVPFNYDYDGSSFGLLSNSIHHLDLFSYFSKKLEMNLRFDGLEYELKSSKRSGFDEAFGNLVAFDSNGNSLHLCSYKNGDAQDIVIIRNCFRRYVIDFKTGKTMYSGVDNHWEWCAFEYPKYFQSTISHWFVDDLLNSGTCSLSTYQDSMKLHLNFLKGLCDHLRERKTSLHSDLVRIT